MSDLTELVGALRLHKAEIYQSSAAAIERLTAERDALLAQVERLTAELNAYRTAGLTVREDCAHEALAEAQVCGCGQRITERIRTVQGRGFGTADICQRCRGLQPCGCGHEADLHQRRLEALLEAERENTALRERLSTLDPSAGGFVCGD